jgi:hypothetical protein
MAQTSCRTPEQLNDWYERAAEERGVFKSEVVREALWFYARENPDEIAVSGVGTTENREEERAGDPDRTTPAGESTQSGSSGEGGRSRSVGVYDPTGEF